MEVFVGGSKAFKRLPKLMQNRLHELVANGDEVLVGDCRGTDALAQQYLAESGYRTVQVFASGTARCNEGGWSVRSVVAADKQRTPEGRTMGPAEPGTYAFYAAKDQAMALEADCGLMLWNGRSRGTFLDILMLVAQGRHVRVVVAKGAERFEKLVTTPEQLRALLPPRNKNHCASHDVLPAEMRRNIVEGFVPSKDMSSFLAERPLTKRQLVEIVLGSPTPLDKKRLACQSNRWVDDVPHEVIDDVERAMDIRLGKPGQVAPDVSPLQVGPSTVGMFWDHALASSFGTHADAIEQALQSMPRGYAQGPHDLKPETIVYRKDEWDEQPDLYEDHEAGVAPYASIDAAFDDLRFEMDDEEWDDDAPCWTALEVWRFSAQQRSWRNLYTFYAIRDELVFFDKMFYDERERWWRPSKWPVPGISVGYGGDFIGRLDVPTPFKAGDIITLDCRPFAPIAHGIVLIPEEKGVTYEAPYVLARSYGATETSGAESPWYTLSLKHGAGLHISMPGYSLLYRAEVYHGDLPEHERVLEDVQQWIGGDPVKAEQLDGVYATSKDLLAAIDM